MKFDAQGPIGYYYEDFEVGARLVTRGRTITESDLVQFAALTGDYNPMHTDEQYAQKSFMGRRVAHGLLTLSYAVGQAYQLGILERTVLAFRELEMKFSLPVAIGDTIRAELTVLEKQDARRLGGGTVKLEMRVTNQDGKAVQKGVLTLLVAARPAE
ncbi:MAG: MaoC/PaaZ C-terminal domain-containing protein [Anaerolineae bacterium]|nr:MaoC/PaaZ C-terminal domain-containing protein [Anaerolineae bacterium]MDW8170950.1 MaoC/PaaZ C-terminal domain-containing protein [Anaerolineae bacterium]